jgi:4-amino-4-deoxy-L-arabinose transferase-like glycosyltransferase
LARSPLAQPVAFAFGGEAGPLDYARAMADAGLLALIACLGLAQLSHEATPALAQLAFTAVLFYGLSAASREHTHWWPRWAVGAGLAGLALSGAPSVALLFGLGAVVVDSLQRRPTARALPRLWRSQVLLLSLAAVLLAAALDLWHWRLDVSQWGQAASQKSGASIARLFVWFMWPAWPLALWTLWRWRRQWDSRHIALPLWFVAVVVVSTLLTTASDRGLLLALPPLAALAAFALPTLGRSVASLIDWFTLIFFTLCGTAIWVVWIALQTGVPRQPAANVARLLPGFEPSFSLLALLVALAATLAWAWLVHWRTGRHRSPIWKSLVLPAGGATLCWLLLTSLWLPLLNHGRGYAPAVRQVLSVVDRSSCVATLGLSTAQSAALRYHGHLELRALRSAQTHSDCPFLIIDPASQQRLKDVSAWTPVRGARRATDKNDDMLIYRRARLASAGSAPRE